VLKLLYGLAIVLYLAASWICCAERFQWEISLKLTCEYLLDAAAVRSRYHDGQGGMPPISGSAVNYILHD
jgi:hypothetical protein